MADPGNLHGIRAPDNTIRAPSILRKDNYRSWAMKLKAALKVMECWRIVEGTELIPTRTAPVGSSAAVIREAAAAKVLWEKKSDRASSLLVTSIHDDEMITIYGFDDDRFRCGRGSLKNMKGRVRRKRKRRRCSCWILLTSRARLPTPQSTSSTPPSSTARIKVWQMTRITSSVCFFDIPRSVTKL